MIGNNIAIFVKKSGKKQCDIAAEIGMSAPLFSQIVNGISVPEQYQLDRICKAINCNADELYTKTVLEMIRNNRPPRIKSDSSKPYKDYNRTYIAKELYDELYLEAQETGKTISQLATYYIKRGKYKCN